MVIFSEGIASDASNARKSTDKKKQNISVMIPTLRSMKIIVIPSNETRSKPFSFEWISY